MKVKKALHQPKSLTPKMRRNLDLLVERFKENDLYKNVKRGDLKKAAQDLIGTKAAPRWITRNETVRKSRGMYDLSVLLQLPVVDEPEEDKKSKKSETVSAGE